MPAVDGPRIPILDSGYIQLIETWGSDERVIESARMSTGKGFLGWGPLSREACSRCNGLGRCGRWGDSDSDDDTKFPCPECRGSGVVEKPGDEKLLRFLYENRHSGPFEMAGMTIEVSAPIMVFREWHRHRTQGYNEMSARYVPLPNENYRPTVDRIVSGARGAGTNKQAQGSVTIAEPDALAWLAELGDVYEHAQRVYESGIRIGVPKELARLPVPVGRYSRMRATANLRNWLGFCSLRSDYVPQGRAAQWEIRQYANWVGGFICEHFGRTFALFAEAKV